MNFHTPRKPQQLIRTTISNSGAFSTTAFTNNQNLQTLEPNTQLTALVSNDAGVRTVQILGPENTVTIDSENTNIKACGAIIHQLKEGGNVIIPAQQ